MLYSYLRHRLDLYQYNSNCTLVKITTINHKTVYSYKYKISSNMLHMILLVQPGIVDIYMTVYVYRLKALYRGEIQHSLVFNKPPTLPAW